MIKLIKFETRGITFDNIVAVVRSGLTLLSTIFRSYHVGVLLQQGAQCSLL